MFLKVMKDSSYMHAHIYEWCFYHVLCMEQINSPKHSLQRKSSLITQHEHKAWPKPIPGIV